MRSLLECLNIESCPIQELEEDADDDSDTDYDVDGEEMEGMIDLPTAL